MKYFLAIPIFLLFFSCSKTRNELPALIPFPLQFELKKGLEIASAVSFQTDNSFQTEQEILEKWLAKNGIITTQNTAFRIELKKAKVENP